MDARKTEQVKSYKLVVGVDLSDASAAVLRRGFELASATPGSELHVVMVAQYARPSLVGVEGFPATTIPADAAERLQALVSFALDEFAAVHGPLKASRVVLHVLAGAPADEIVWLAAHVDADAIVVGTHGHRGARRLLLGSVAERVVRIAGCPVFVERPKHHNEAWRVPEIEPPCEDCLAARQESEGRQLWCKRHIEHHFHAHVYSYQGMQTDSVQAWGLSRIS